MKLIYILTKTSNLKNNDFISNKKIFFSNFITIIIIIISILIIINLIHKNIFKIFNKQVELHQFHFLLEFVSNNHQHY